jgi:hypothetical protein
MALTWIDISLLTLLICLGAVLVTQSLMYLTQRDAQEVRRNRQAACRRHEWNRLDPTTGLVCRLCGKIPG